MKPIMPDQQLLPRGMFLHYDSPTTLLVSNGRARSQHNTHDIIVSSGNIDVRPDRNFSFYLIQETNPILYTKVDLTAVMTLNGTEQSISTINNGIMQVYAIASSAEIAPTGFFASLNLYYYNEFLDCLTLPIGYDLYRIIGDIKVENGVVKPFVQYDVHNERGHIRTMHFE